MRSLFVALLIGLFAFSAVQAQTTSITQTSRIVYVKVPVVEYTYKVRVPLALAPPLPAVKPLCPRPIVRAMKPASSWYQNSYVYFWQR